MLNSDHNVSIGKILSYTWTIGSTKAKVFPLPVGAETQISCGQYGCGSLCCSSTNGITSSCTGNSTSTPSLRRVDFNVLCSQGTLSTEHVRFCRLVDTPCGWDNQCGRTLWTYN